MNPCWVSDGPRRGGDGKAAAAGPAPHQFLWTFKNCIESGPGRVGLFTGASPKVNKTLGVSWSKVLAILDSGTSQIGLAF